MTWLSADYPVRLVHLTDTHLFASPGECLHKVNTRHSLQRVVRAIGAQQQTIDLLLATGDIAQDGSEAACAAFIDAVAKLAVPFRWLPGNHDDAAAMSAAAVKSVTAGSQAGEKSLAINNWQLLLLDTTIQGQVHGCLSRNELDFLEAGLRSAEREHRIAHCLICLHHNPVPASARWMSGMGLANGADFFQLVSRFTKVRAVVYGHIHQELDYEHEGVRCFCSPSTCIQFRPDAGAFELDDTRPGYRTLALHEAGAIESRVWRLPVHCDGATHDHRG